MATNHITVSRNSAQGADLLSIVDQFRIYQDRLRQNKEMMDAQVDGADYSAIETQFGVNSGSGQTVYNLVAGASAEVTSATNFNQMLDYLVPLG